MFNINHTILGKHVLMCEKTRHTGCTLFVILMSLMQSAIATTDCVPDPELWPLKTIKITLDLAGHGRKDARWNKPEWHLQESGGVKIEIGRDIAFSVKVEVIPNTMRDICVEFYLIKRGEIEKKVRLVDDIGDRAKPSWHESIPYNSYELTVKWVDYRPDKDTSGELLKLVISFPPYKASTSYFVLTQK